MIPPCRCFPDSGSGFGRLGTPGLWQNGGFHERYSTIRYRRAIRSNGEADQWIRTGIPHSGASGPGCGPLRSLLWWPHHSKLSITGIQTESDPNPLSRVTGNLKDIGTPAPVGRKSDHPSFMGSFRPGYSSGQQKGVSLQDPIDPLVIDRKPSLGLSSSVQNGLDPSVPIGRSPVDNFPQRGKKSGIVFRRGTRTLFLLQSTSTEKIRPGNFQGAAYRLHRESFSGKDGFRAIHFFSWATSSASWRISTFMVFRPRIRSSSRMRFFSYLASEVPTTDSSAFRADSPPSLTSFRHRKRRMGAMPFCRATKDTLTPGRSGSSTIRIFSDTDHRRRCWTVATISTASLSLALPLDIGTPPGSNLRT